MQSLEVFRAGDSNHMPHMGYDPTPAPEEEQTLDPTTVANPTGNAALLRTISDIHRLQQENMRRKGAGRKGTSKGKTSREPQRHQHFVEYDGLDDQCSICQAEFLRQERVYRLVCNHLFHKECYDAHIHSHTATAT